jgi:uncharacterized membrane protein
MAAALSRAYRAPLHPLHAILLAGSLPLFLGVLLSDLAYSCTYQIQWKNFASWLLVGALVFCGLALLWALIDVLRADRRGRRPFVYFVLLLATFVLGFIDALVHAKDAWASMPAALTLSIIVAVLAVLATALGFSTLGQGEAR